MSTEPLVTLEVRRKFSASPERVYDAWLDPKLAAIFLFSTPKGQMVRAEIDAQVGGRFTMTDRRDGVDVDHVGEYLVLDRPRKLVFTFAVPKYSELYTKVTIEIVPEGEGCELTLLHEGVLPEWGDPTRQGWNAILGQLAETLDT
jgi:uncharacterized protein YndB with AHSA1/START domain